MSLSTSASMRWYSALVSMITGRARASSRPYFMGLSLAGAVILPFLPVVFRRSQHIPYVYSLPRVFNFSDQPIFVPGDVEHRTGPNEVGMREVPPDLFEVKPTRLPCQPVPGIQRYTSVRMTRCEFVKGGPAYHVHLMMFTYCEHLVNNSSD